MKSNCDYLKRVGIFKDVGDLFLESVSNVCARKKLSSGEVLFFEGEQGGALYVVLSGSVRIERISQRGELVVLAVRGAGEVIGEMSLLDGQVRSAQATAVSDCRLLVIYQSDFQEVVLRSPEVSLAIMRQLSLRIRESGDLVLDQKLKLATERTHDYLVANCREDDEVFLFQPQHVIAELIGCSRETLCRSLNELVKQGRWKKLGRRRFQRTHP